MNTLVIGAGTMGRTHAAAYASMEDINLVGIVDQDADRAIQLAEQTGTEWFRTYEEAVEKVLKIDVVSICVPTPFHKEYLEKAADNDSHVVCEKPLARSLEDARDMIAYCKEKGVKLFVGHVVRFFPEYVKAKEVLDAGKIGKPAVVNTTRGGAFPTASNDWYSNYGYSGGLVLDMIIHDFDYLRWCFGEVVRVYAKSTRGRVISRLEYALVTLRFESGVIAHVEGTWAHDRFTTKLEIAGSEGIIKHDSSKIEPVLKSVKQSDAAQGVAVPESPLEKNPYEVELRHFLDCIVCDREPIVTPEDAYKAMEISLAALESIETGKVVDLAGRAMEVGK